MKIRILALITIICFSCQQRQDIPEKIAIQTNWQFKKVADTLWNPASRPDHANTLAHC